MNLKIQVQVTVDNKNTLKGEIDSDHYCYVDLIRTIQNNKDPVQALAFLAEIGSKALSHSQFDRDDFTISVLNFLGKSL